MSIPPQAIEYVQSRVADAEFRDWCVGLLCRLTDIDTAIKPDVSASAAGEGAVFDAIEAELRALCGGRVQLERQPIDPAIAADPYFSELYYTRSAANPAGLTVEQCYPGRANLLALFDGDGSGRGTPTIWNAHVDTVAPFYPSRRGEGRTHGRGSADDKAAVVAWIAQIRLIEECRERFGLSLAAPRCYQFVIEEESGGNGSLSVVRDERFAGWPIIVGEVTGNVPHPANRGALWYRCELSGSADPRINLVEMAAHVVLALEGLGRQFKAEGAHPLFRPEHVQTCHGIIGPHGKHPSAVSDFVPLTIAAAEQVTESRLRGLRQALDAALAEYVARYGDKTAELDEQGRPKVAVHYELDTKSTPFALRVFGKAGHMGAIHRLDCAIIKAAFLVAGIMEANESAGRPMWRVGLADLPDAQRTLVLEGGQGFTPSHAMDDVQRRMIASAESAAADYVRSLGGGVKAGGPFAATTFDKLHNAAFACPADSPAMAAMQQVYGLLGLDWPVPSGWAVSCDARIFARDGRDVLTYGPGTLGQAHAADEFVTDAQLFEAVAVSTLTAIELAGIA